jgi:hypothetical protein
MSLNRGAGMGLQVNTVLKARAHLEKRIKELKESNDSKSKTFRQ